MPDSCMTSLVSRNGLCLSFIIIIINHCMSRYKFDRFIYIYFMYIIYAKCLRACLNVISVPFTGIYWGYDFRFVYIVSTSFLL